MKKLYLVGIVTLLLIGLLTWGIGPVMAQDNAEFTKINKPFGVGQFDSAFAHNIPKGSTICQLAEGVTEVRDTKNMLILTAKDDEAALIPTPGGLRRATHILQLPSNSRIEIDGNITKVFEGNRCILTAVEQASKTSSNEVIPDFDGWIEWTEDWTVDELDWFRAYWEDHPLAPKGPLREYDAYVWSPVPQLLVPEPHKPHCGIGVTRGASRQVVSILPPPYLTSLHSQGSSANTALPTR